MLKLLQIIIWDGPLEILHKLRISGGNYNASPTTFQPCRQRQQSWIDSNETMSLECSPDGRRRFTFRPHS